MSDIIKRLHARRLQLTGELRGLAERAVDEHRDATAEEQGQAQAISEELDNLAKRIQGFMDQAKRDKDQDEEFAALERRPVEVGTGAERSSEHGVALRSFLTGQPGSPRFFDVRPQGQLPIDFRDLSKLTAGAGGNTVPVSFFNRLMAHLIEVAAIMRTGATVLNTGSGESLQVPKTTAHSTAVLTAEAAAIAESDPVFGQTTLGAFKYGVIIQVSRELVEDTGVDLEGYLAMQAGRALGNAFGTHAIVGTGTTQPRGVTLDSTLGVTGTAGVGGAFTADQLIDLFFSVIEPYRNSSSTHWLLRDASMATIRKLKDTTNQYIWQPGLQAGVPDLLLGKPVITDPNVAAVGLAAKSVVFGDFSQYFVRLAGGVRFERSDEFAFNTDLVTFRATLRADGALIDLTGAVKHFIGNAA